MTPGIQTLIQPPRCSPTATARARVVIHGMVQGVGFRPFIFRLATELGLTGGVSNTAQGVVLELEGHRARLETLLLRLARERPPHSSIQSLETTWLDPVGHAEFGIWPSDDAGETTALVLPDIATCAECVRDLFEPGNRRMGYPFTNCTHCGPRFSIINALPYDRKNTSMAGFEMCPDCRAEYDDPANRRFHAQPNACPTCGPHVELWDRAGHGLRTRREALLEAVRAIREGAIVAVKGLGGFHLVALARDEQTVERLRAAKHRDEKPFAVMFPSVENAAVACEVSPLEERLLTSSEAPIVLLRRRPGGADVCAGVAPGNPLIGALLPYTPLHHLLLAGLSEPVVATSGNLADEPICTDEHEALTRLGAIADMFLTHNRPIVRHVDDSVVRVVAGRELVLRRARGYAPLPLTVRETLPAVAGVGAQLKNTVALARGRQVFLSQHVGDLETAPALAAHVKVVADLGRLLGAEPEVFAADRHHDYAATLRALRSGKPVVCVQHHYAHVLACMAENDLSAPVLGVSWDGTGLGMDQTIWGGEFLRITSRKFERVGHLRTFRLPGGDRAIQEPRRSALGLLAALHGDRAYTMTDLATLRAFAPSELPALRRMIATGINSPLTSSAGRLFDAVASLTGLRQRSRFEGQAAMDLEFALERDESEDVYPMPLRRLIKERAASNDNPRQPCPIHADCEAYKPSLARLILDWGPLIEKLVEDLRAGIPVWELSARFHNTLADGITAVAKCVRERRVVLTGGCFQNRYLLERTVECLRSEGFIPYWHQRVPPNDGGIAIGQVLAAIRQSFPPRPPCA